ncbi:MAG: His/Gly/Thr/Pro-type tRNA ligase C-terminal domain-containing protein [Patescibacteria group bacterium]|nr:His/Gly/Thr/Pro-type tRNA ligase C-terminal domain-containing protein [Patescibacteria group bacterium]
MLQSKLFTKTRKEAPKDEVALNAQLLIRAGYIHKEMAGVYSFLPLGLRVMNKISNIIRHEMNAIGGQEIFLTVLQDKNLWEKTDRWDDGKVDNWFKTKLKNGTEIGLGSTHEEELTALMRDYIRSWRDLPVYTYQIQTKFRNEARAKSGIMRGREFLMKDLYSFSKDEKSHAEFYEKAKQAYVNIFNRMGIGEKTYITHASGGIFSKYSHEFQTTTSAGEDIIHICEKCHIAVNAEIKGEEIACPICTNKDLKQDKAVEVGNIFNLGTRFSEALDLTYQDENGEKKVVVMGCYGIGLGRVMGTIVEVFADEAGIVWPEEVAPYRVHLVSIGNDKEIVKKYVDQLYSKLLEHNIEVLYDDRDVRPGEKFADSDLIGIPWRIVVSEKLMSEKMIEMKNRKTGEVKKMDEKEMLKCLKI